MRRIYVAGTIVAGVALIVWATWSSFDRRLAAALGWGDARIVPFPGPHTAPADPASVCPRCADDLHTNPVGRTGWRCGWCESEWMTAHADG